MVSQRRLPGRVYPILPLYPPQSLQTPTPRVTALPRGRASLRQARLMVLQEAWMEECCAQPWGHSWQDGCSQTCLSCPSQQLPEGSPACQQAQPQLSPAAPIGTPTWSSGNLGLSPHPLPIPLSSQSRLPSPAQQRDRNCPPASSVLPSHIRRLTVIHLPQGAPPLARPELLCAPRALRQAGGAAATRAHSPAHN